MRLIALSLADALKRAEGSPLDWGRDDCLMWIADIYAEAFDRDPAAPYRGRYRTRIGAKRVMGRRGVLGALIEASRLMVWPRVDPEKAKTGDLGVIMTPDGLAGVIRGETGWFGRIDYGVSCCPNPFVLRAWSVG